MKIFHEAPLSIFDRVQKITDGDFALVHLIESDDRYKKKFVDAINKGRTVFLDNSLYELRTAFDRAKFARSIEDLRPTAYIVPDSWKDGKETVALFKAFVRDFKSVSGRRIGVAQGMDVDEVLACYTELENDCDVIAFNFDGSAWWYSLGHSDPLHVAMSKGRHAIITELIDRGNINPDKDHHLLGIGVPQEIGWYCDRKYKMITSIDTSNPVTHGLNRIRYRPYGLTDKVGDIIAEDIDRSVDDDQWDAIESNINQFRRFANDGTKYE